MNKYVRIQLVTDPMKEEDAIQWAQRTTTFDAYLYRERPNTYTVCRLLTESDRINPVFDSIVENIQATSVVRVRRKS